MEPNSTDIMHLRTAASKARQAASLLVEADFEWEGMPEEACDAMHRLVGAWMHVCIAVQDLDAAYKSLGGSDD